MSRTCGIRWLLAVAGLLLWSAVPPSSLAQPPPEPAGQPPEEEQQPDAPVEEPEEEEEGESSGSDAAEEDESEVEDPLEAFIRALTSLPDAPATFALGVSSDQIARPGSLRELGAQVFSYVDAQGDLKPGLAVEVGPSLLADHVRTGDAYSWAESFRLSFATAVDPDAVAGTQAATLVAVGFRVTPVNERDLRFNRTARRKVRDLLLVTLPGDPDATVCPPFGPDADVDEVARIVRESGCRPPQEIREGDSPIVDRGLEEVYDELASGWRFEVAGAGVFRANAADWRAARLWIVTEYSAHAESEDAASPGTEERPRAAVFGVAVDGSLRDGDNLGTAESLVAEVRTGLYGELETRPATFRLQAGYRFLSDVALAPGTLDEHSLLFGASTSLRAGDAVVRAGMNGSYGSNAGFTMSLVASLGWGTEEDLLFEVAREVGAAQE